MKYTPYSAFDSMDIDFLKYVDDREVVEIGKAVCRYAIIEMEKQEWFDGYMLDELQSIVDNIGGENERYYYLNVLKKLESDIGYYRAPKMDGLTRDIYNNVISVMRHSFWVRNGSTHGRSGRIMDLVAWIKFLAMKLSNNCQIMPEQVIGVITEICVSGSK